MQSHLQNEGGGKLGKKAERIGFMMKKEKRSRGRGKPKLRRPDDSAPKSGKLHGPKKKSEHG